MYQKNNDVLGTVNRGNPCESGLCTLCRSDCTGKCETFMSSLVGRKMLYPRDFGTVTAGSSNNYHVGVSYNNLRIKGNYFGAKGSVSNAADDCLFTNVSLETSFGKEVTTKVKAPFMTGALGSTFIAAKYWNSFAIGAALTGVPIVIGENVVGVDKESVIENGKIIKSPELERRIDTYMKYYDGYGAIIVQMNVEDTHNGVAEYVINKYGDKVIIELKWGQGAKDIGGEIQVNSLEYARFLKDRGYLVDPDPYNEEAVEAFKSGSIKAFSRHSRLGNTNLNSYEEVRESFLNSIKYLREIGYKRITLKTGAYGNEALAAAIKLASEAHLDLLTLDGAGGGTGMSPWNMMETWGLPSIYLHSKAYEYASLLDSTGKNVVDIAFGGGLAREDHIFKALALGGPYTKLICMGRTLMIPAFVGSNIEGALNKDRKSQVNGNWNQLPAWMEKELGTSVEELFAGYYDVQKKVGSKEIKNIPYGAIGFCTLADKLTAGLQQFLAGAHKFNINEIGRDDLYAANNETSEITGISHMVKVNDDIAKEIILS